MIRIDKDYVIDVDEAQYTLKQDAHKMSMDKRTGQESPVYYVVGYYRNLENALRGYIRLQTDKRLKGGEYALREALDVIREEREKVERMITEYTGEAKEAVRCKDCRYKHEGDKFLMCNRNKGVFRVEADDFCSKGERDDG